MTLDQLYTLQDVADALGMSPRWMRQKVKDGAAHTRLGQKIRFTEEQYQALVEAHAKSTASPVASLTTGRGRRK